jgi:hypothetical protein
MRNDVDKGWNPYAAGALTGLLLILSAWVADKYVGTSTTFAKTAGMIGKLIAPDRVGAMEYFVKEIPKIDWQWMFVAGILIGSFIAATTSGTFRLKAVPDMWERRFGRHIATRGIVAFLGGFIALFGARLADG